MRNLSSLLGRLSKVLNEDSSRKELVINTIKEKTGILLNSGQIFIKDGNLEIKASPAANNEIRLKEEDIRKELKLLRVLYR